MVTIGNMWRPIVDRVQTAVGQLLTDLEEFANQIKDEFLEEDNISWEDSDDSSEWGSSQIDAWGKSHHTLYTRPTLPREHLPFQ